MLVIAFLAAVVGILIGTVGISIARQLFHESYAVSAMQEADQAITLRKGQLFLYNMMSAGTALQGEYALQTAETPFGTLTAVVCWDADFPMTMRQAGKQGADIILVPIGDPAGPLAVLHAQQHLFRAIENGASLVRHEYNRGWSVAADPYGRILATLNLSTASERVMVAQVPTQGVFTLYPVIGDLFAWLAVVGFVGMAGWAIVRGRRQAA